VSNRAIQLTSLSRNLTTTFFKARISNTKGIIKIEVN
jgi:hypothetical protein